MHQEAIRAFRDALSRDIKAKEGLILQKELQQRMRVLRRLGYIDESGIVTQKGHVCLSIKFLFSLSKPVDMEDCTSPILSYVRIYSCRRLLSMGQMCLLLAPLNALTFSFFGVVNFARVL